MRILVEGWRFNAHSYALVNQFQCLELLHRPEVDLRHVDAPFGKFVFKSGRGSLDPISEAEIKGMPEPEAGWEPDLIYRISYPLNFTPSPKRLMVFGTSEFLNVRREQLMGGKKTLSEWLENSNAQVVTPSQWSRRGFIASGADPARVHVVPHGVDPTIFHPISQEQRLEWRRRFGWEEDEFVFLHVGSMTLNKNIAMLLRALAAVAERYPRVKLALKGFDTLHQSQNHLVEATDVLSDHEAELVDPRIVYWGTYFPMDAMSILYQAADCYVSPYLAEGFNLPALEAAASGCPVICTKGGATDDFTTPEFALGIEATLAQLPEFPGSVLSVDFDSLVSQMCRVIDDQDFVAQARVAGPRHIAERFTWKKVVDQLLEVFKGVGNR
jgi:glycosyltransferase involved in cell wall biosynthesis